MSSNPVNFKDIYYLPLGRQRKTHIIDRSHRLIALILQFNTCRNMSHTEKEKTQQERHSGSQQGKFSGFLRHHFLLLLVSRCTVSEGRNIRILFFQKLIVLIFPR